jgi:hypothetical protein
MENELLYNGDLFAIGSFDVMSTYCQLVKYYGLYHNQNIPHFPDGVRRWMFAPEFQLWSLLWEKHNIPYQETKSIGITIVRHNFQAFKALKTTNSRLRRNRL